MAATSDRPATRRFTADEVWRMVDIGLLDEDEPYELIDGELLYMSPQGEPHAKVITRLTMFFAAQYGPTGHAVRVQMPLGGLRDSIPEPDLAVVTVDVAEGDTHPSPDQTLLIVEVGVTSQRRDQRKAQIYATAGAPEFWRIDIPADVVIVHREPQADGTWRVVTHTTVGDQIELPGADRQVAVAGILRRPTG